MPPFLKVPESRGGAAGGVGVLAKGDLVLRAALRRGCHWVGASIQVSVASSGK